MSDSGIERIAYNCVCDEYVSLRCANDQCGYEIKPEETVLVTSDGAVFCSEWCVEATES